MKFIKFMLLSSFILLVACTQKIDAAFLQNNSWVTDLEAFDAPTAYEANFFEDTASFKINEASLIKLYPDEIDEGSQLAVDAIIDKSDVNYMYEIQDEQLLLAHPSQPENIIIFDIIQTDDGFNIRMAESDANQERVDNLNYDNIQSPADFEIKFQKAE